MASNIINHEHPSTVFRRDVTMHQASCNSVTITALALLTIGALTAALVCHTTLPHLPSLSTGLFIATGVSAFPLVFLALRSVCATSAASNSGADQEIKLPNILLFEPFLIQGVQFTSCKEAGNNYIKVDDLINNKTDKYPLVIIREGQEVISMEDDSAFFSYHEDAKRVILYAKEAGKSLTHLPLKTFISSDDLKHQCAAVYDSTYTLAPSLPTGATFDQRGFCYTTDAKTLSIYTQNEEATGWNAPINALTVDPSLLEDITSLVEGRNQICTIENGVILFYEIQEDFTTKAMSYHLINQDKLIQSSEEVGLYMQVVNDDLRYQELDGERVQFYKGLNNEKLGSPIPCFANIEEMDAEDFKDTTYCFIGRDGTDLKIYNTRNKTKYHLSHFQNLETAIENHAFLMHQSTSTYDPDSWKKDIPQQAKELVGVNDAYYVHENGQFQLWERDEENDGTAYTCGPVLVYTKNTPGRLAAAVKPGEMFVGLEGEDIVFYKRQNSFPFTIEKLDHVEYLEKNYGIFKSVENNAYLLPEGAVIDWKGSQEAVIYRPTDDGKQLELFLEGVAGRFGTIPVSNDIKPSDLDKTFVPLKHMIAIKQQDDSFAFRMLSADRTLFLDVPSGSILENKESFIKIEELKKTSFDLDQFQHRVEHDKIESVGPSVPIGMSVVTDQGTVYTRSGESPFDMFVDEDPRPELIVNQEITDFLDIDRMYLSPPVHPNGKMAVYRYIGSENYKLQFMAFNSETNEWKAIEKCCFAEPKLYEDELLAQDPKNLQTGIDVILVNVDDGQGAITDIACYTPHPFAKTWQKVDWETVEQHQSYSITVRSELPESEEE